MNNTRMSKYVLISVLSASCFIAAYFSFFLNPIREDIMNLKREYSTILAEVLSYANYDDDLSFKDEYMQKITNETKDAIDSLPDYISSYEILEIFSGIDELPIQRSSLIFLSSSDYEQYKVLPVRLSFSTHVEGLKQFFQYLGNTGHIISIDNFCFSSNTGSDNKNNDLDSSSTIDSPKDMGYNLSVVLTVNFYLKPEAPEDQEGSLTDENAQLKIAEK